MLKLVKAEFVKCRRKKLFTIAFLTTFLMPVFYSLLLKDGDFEDLCSIVLEENGFLLLIPLSVVLAANLFFAEQDHDTLKNLLCVPVSKKRLALAKLFVILIFDMAYQLAGYLIAVLLALLTGTPLKHFGLQLLLVLGESILLWAAAMPCLLLVIWCNKSYIISVLIAFAYTLAGYILHISDKILRVPLGFNIQTFLPVPMIFRWLYQFHSLEDAGPVITEFYERFSPFFVPTPVIFGVMAAETAVCMFLMMQVYKRRD